METPLGGGDPSVPGTGRQPSDQIAYMQKLLDEAHREIAEYKAGFVVDIQRPLLMELIGMAHVVEQFLNTPSDQVTAAQYRSFLEDVVLGDIREALSRYGVELFICSTHTINRRLQKVEQVVETDDPALDGRVWPVLRGYVQGDRVLQKEHVIQYKAPNR